MLGVGASSDMIAELLGGNPNEPVNRGVVLLFRNEMKAEFHTLRGDFHTSRTEFNTFRTEVHQRMDKLEKSVELVAQYVAKILDRLDARN